MPFFQGKKNTTHQTATCWAQNTMSRAQFFSNDTAANPEMALD